MNTVGARMVFENAKKAINKAFPLDQATNGRTQEASELCKLTQSYLRLEQAWILSKTSYEFPILINQATAGVFNTEQRLNQQDSFITSEVGIFLGAPASALDAAFLLDTYPNPAIYTAANAAVQLQCLYSGTLNIAVNNDILVPSWDVSRHYYAPETQQTAPVGAGSPLDQRRLAVDGFYPMEPNVVFIGSKKNTLKIELPAAPSAIQTNARIIIVLRGVLAQNSTVVS